MVMALTKDGPTTPGSSYPTSLDHVWAREQDQRPHHWHPPRDRRPPSLSPSPPPSPPPPPPPPPSDLEYWPERNPHHSEHWTERNPNDSEYWPERNHDDHRYPDDRLIDDQFTEALYPEDQYPEDQYPEDQYPEVQSPEVHSPVRRGRPSPVVGPSETVALGGPFSGSWADALRLIKQDMSKHGLVECASGDDNMPSTPLRQLERAVQSHERREGALERRRSSRSSCREDRRGGREEEERGEGYGWRDERRRARGGREEEERMEGNGWRSEPRRLRHSASVRCTSSSSAGGRPTRPLERIGSWASSHSGDKRVHFLDDRRRHNGSHGDGRRAYEGSYEGFRERGDGVRSSGDPRPPSGRSSRGHQTYPFEDDWHHLHHHHHHHHQQHQQQQVPPLQRNAFARRSYHGDTRQNRQRHSFRDGRSNGYHHRNSNLGSDSRSIPEERGGQWEERGGQWEEHGGEWAERAAWERRSYRSYREQRGRLHSPGHQVASPPPPGERDAGARGWHSERRAPAVAGGRWHQELVGEDVFSSGEEGVWERRVDRHTSRSHRPADTGKLGALALLASS